MEVPFAARQASVANFSMGVIWLDRDRKGNRPNPRTRLARVTDSRRFWEEFEAAWQNGIGT